MRLKYKFRVCEKNNSKKNWFETQETDIDIDDPDDSDEIKTELISEAKSSIEKFNKNLKPGEVERKFLSLEDWEPVTNHEDDDSDLIDDDDDLFDDDDTEF